MSINVTLHPEVLALLGVAIVATWTLAHLRARRRPRSHPRMAHEQAGRDRS